MRVLIDFSDAPPVFRRILGFSQTKIPLLQMQTATATVDFLWWNLQNFAHFDVRKVDDPRWPKSTPEYEEKLRRIERVVTNLSTKRLPDLLAFAEITEEAANGLRGRFCPSYKVYSIALSDKLDLNIALIYNPTIGFGEEELLTFSNVPGSTRPMAILNFRSGRNLIRFYVGHWTARFSEGSDQWRQRSAFALSDAVYGFLFPDVLVREARHVVVLGDFNEEPYGLLEESLFAHRDRARAKYPLHYTDKSIKRAHLYNCAWKLLGEQSFHPLPSLGRSVAGSYYWREKKAWRTFDQILVSGSLLTSEVPFLDESSIQLVSSRDILPDNFLATDGLPQAFEWNHGTPSGISDHLPLFGRLII